MESCEWLNEVASNLRWQKVFRENGDLERARKEEEVRVERLAEGWVNMERG